MDLAYYGMDKSFEILGKWTPDYLNFQEAITGTLVYGPNELTLEVYGDFEFWTRTERIYGFAQDGKLIWIPHVHSHIENHSQSGYSIKNFSFQECFIFDMNLQELDLNEKEAFEDIFKDATTDFKIHELSFKTNHLLSWFGESMQFSDKNNELTIPYGTLNQQNYPYNDMDLKTEWTQVSQSTARQIQIASEAEIYLKRHQEKPEFFKRLFQESLNIKKLIELFCEDDNFFDAISFRRNENGLAFKGRYLVKQRASRSASLLPDSVLTLHDLNNNFNQILENYYSKREKLDLVVDTYLNEFYLNETPETKILNSIRNLEIYHRNFMEGNLPEHTNEALEVERLKINAFIDENVDPNYQVRMKSQVNYSPEKNLRKRLQELMQRMPDAVFEHLEIKGKNRRKSRQISSFAYHVVETRNYYTHRDSPDRYPGRIQTMDELLEVNHILRKICLYYIYYELGIDEKLILSAL